MEERFVVGEGSRRRRPVLRGPDLRFPDEAAATAFVDGQEAAYETGGIDSITGVRRRSRGEPPAR
jgi:hypothetical protein